MQKSFFKINYVKITTHATAICWQSLLKINMDVNVLRAYHYACSVKKKKYVAECFVFVQLIRSMVVVVVVVVWRWEIRF